MRVLVVGAGAVGQVYGYHLARGGAEVFVYVRPRHRAQAEEGFDLFAIHSRKNREARHFRPHGVVCDPSEVETLKLDQIWLCVPTTALFDGSVDPLLDAIASGKNADATVVSLQPGTFAKAELEKRIAAPRIVFGVIGLQSFHAPLEGSSAPYEMSTGPGTAYFFPPMNPCKFSGIGDRTRAVVDALHMGNAPARAVRDAWVDLGLSSAMLMPPIAALEICGWSLERFRVSEESAIASRAVREASRIAAHSMGEPDPYLTALMRPIVVRLALGFIGPRLAPFDLESFLRVHFGKVSAQTHLMLDNYLHDGEAAHLETSSLRELVKRLRAPDPKIAPPDPEIAEASAS